jgi:hypothetical protein
MSTADASPSWDDLKALLRWAGALFGEPADLFDERVMERKQWRLLRTWIVALEAIARALLAAMAASLPPPKPAVAPRRTAKDDAKATVAPYAAEKASGHDGPEMPPSEQWAGVVFRCALPEPRGSAGRPRREPFRFVATRGLAYRFEALVRVAEEPLRYAQRLARKLSATPGLASRVLREPRWPGGRTLFEEDIRLALVQARGSPLPGAPDTG